MTTERLFVSRPFPSDDSLISDESPTAQSVGGESDQSQIILKSIERGNNFNFNLLYIFYSYN